MANHSLEITLTGNERPDGSIYLFSEGLPGFHFILAAGEDPQEVVKPALMKFKSQWKKIDERKMKPDKL